MDGLGQDVPATRKSRRREAASPYQRRKEVSRKMRDTAGAPLEEAASSLSSLMTNV